MKARDMAMMMAGGMLVMAYQKYNKPMMKAVKKSACKNMKKMDKKLDDMM